MSTTSQQERFNPPLLSLLESIGWGAATGLFYSWGQQGWEWGTVISFGTAAMALGRLAKAANDQAAVNRARRKSEKLRRKAQEHSKARFAQVIDTINCKFLSDEEGILLGTIRTGKRKSRDVFFSGEGSVSVIAPPGQGKTMTIVTGTIFNYAERHRRGLSSQNLIINDPSSEILALVYDALIRANYNVYVLTPHADKVDELTQLDPKPNFTQLDIFRWWTPDFPLAELEGKLTQTMQQLVPLDPAKVDSNSEYFIDDARLLAVFLALTLIVNGEKPTLPGMRKLFMGDLLQAIEDAMDSKELDGLYAESASALSVLASGSAPQFTGGYGVLRQCLSPYSEQSNLGLFTRGIDGFDPSQLKHPTERTAVFLISTLDKMKSLSRTTALTLNYLFDAIAADPQHGKCTAIVDEIGGLMWPDLPSSLEYYRKANLRCLMIWQDLQGQAKRNYGDAAMKEILSMSQMLIGMGITEWETLELFAKQCGEKALIDYSTNDRASKQGSPDLGHSEQVKLVSLFAADAIRTMDASQLLAIGGNLPPLKLSKLYYWDRWNDIAGTNPFYEG